MLESHTESRSGEIVTLNAVLIMITTVAVTLRFIARRISKVNFWWDDWTIIVALLFYYGLASTYILMAENYGLGSHTAQSGGPISDMTIEQWYKAYMATLLLYLSTSFLFKTSLILLYYRIFGVVRWYRIALAIAEGIVISCFLVCLFLAILGCRPTSYFWYKSISGTCLNETLYYQYNGVSNLLIDVMILSLTFPMVWRLNMNVRHKITLSGVFLLGTFVCIASIIRISEFHEIQDSDVTYTSFNPAIWSAVEQALGITCACLPILEPLFIRFLPKSFGNKGTAGGYDNYISRLSTRRGVPRRSEDESTKVSLRSASEELSPMSTVTTYATRGPTNAHEVDPEVIMKTQSIEQRWDDVVSDEV